MEFQIATESSDRPLIEENYFKCVNTPFMGEIFFCDGSVTACPQHLPRFGKPFILMSR